MSATTHPVSPADIQTELNRIWEELQTTNTTRASLFNLIFYTKENHRTAYIRRIAQKVIEKFPSRVIFVMSGQNASESYLKTEVSILTASKGEFDVACDYIQIETAGAADERVPFVVLPHLLPDLPVYLIWAEDPSKENSLSTQLSQFANRIIFDSESADDLPKFAKSALKQVDTAHCDIADLNWARIENWRDVFSMTFHSEDKLSQIDNAKKIQITYNSQETTFFCHTKIQSFYLQSWLACQLEWKFTSIQKENKELKILYAGKNGPIEVILSATSEKELPPGIILTVDVVTKSEEHFSFSRTKEALHQITMQYSTPSQCDLPCHYMSSKVEAGHSLVKEICHKGSSQHYLRVLNLIKEIDTQGMC